MHTNGNRISHIRKDELIVNHKFTECISCIMNDMKIASGCTEPAAVALAAAAAGQALNGLSIDRVEVYVCEDFYRNGVNVVIPSTNGLRGFQVAAALGASIANPVRGLQILSGLDIEFSKKAQRIPVEVKLCDSNEKVYVLAKVFCGEDVAEACVLGKHDFIAYVKLNDKIIYENNVKTTDERLAETGLLEDIVINIDDAIDFARNAPDECFAMMKDMVTFNTAIAHYGLEHGSGLGVGKGIREAEESGILASDMVNDAVAYTTAASDARMGGCDMPVMSVAGSGNQGITISLPIIIASKALKVSEQIMLRALALGTLISIHTKAFVGRLSPLCGCGISAGLGACAALTYLQGGNDDQIHMAVKTMVGGISGMVCDGAKPGCSLKIAASVTTAFQVSALVMHNVTATETDGIVCNDAEDSLQNLGKLGRVAMNGATRAIIDMLENKD